MSRDEPPPEAEDFRFSTARYCAAAAASPEWCSQRAQASAILQESSDEKLSKAMWKLG